MGSVPVLDVNGTVLFESAQINRFLGEEYELSGICFIDWFQKRITKYFTNSLFYCGKKNKVTMHYQEPKLI